MENDTDIDELAFPHEAKDAHAEMLRMAAEFTAEGDYEFALEIIDEARGQLADILSERKAKEKGSGVFTMEGNRPTMSLMRPDWEEPRLDNHLDFTK